MMGKLVSNTALPPDLEAIFENGGKVGRFMREMDWTRTPLGPPSLWPQSLRTAIGNCLGARQPLLVWWGPEYLQFYNDQVLEIMGLELPLDIGMPVFEILHRDWSTVAMLVDEVWQTGRSTWKEKQILILQRQGSLAEAYFNYSCSPIFNLKGETEGVFAIATETTMQLIAQERLMTVQALSEAVAKAVTREELCVAVAQVLNGNPFDLPFTLIYETTADGQAAQLCNSSGALKVGSASSPQLIKLGSREAVWPLNNLITADHPLHLKGVSFQLAKDWKEGSNIPVPDQVLILPVDHPSGPKPSAFLVVGVSALRPLDEEYRAFLTLVAKRIAMGLSNVEAHEMECYRTELDEQRKRELERLSALEDAKTTLLNLASHELRGPLATIRGYIELLSDGSFAGRTDLTEKAYSILKGKTHQMELLIYQMLEVARLDDHRLVLEMKKLDFGQLVREEIELLKLSASSRHEISYLQGADVITVLGDEARLAQIVANLLDNAIKYSPDGGKVEVRTYCQEGSAWLEVSDQGLGISLSDQELIFKRFGRIVTAENSHIDGTGLGLYLTRELARMHDGDIQFTSEEKVGSTFRFHIPLANPN